MRIITLILLLSLHSRVVSQTRVENNQVETPLVNEKLVTFDPNRLAIKKVKNRFVLFAEDKELKDLGLDERTADAALRLIRELRVNQYAKLLDGRPPLEYWLIEGQAPRKALSSSDFLTFDPSSLKVEKAFGVWMLRDRKNLIFSFGDNRAAAEDTLAVCKKYRFNQLGFIGSGIPTMTYFLVDPYLGVAEKPSDVNPLEAIQSAERLGLILPEIGLVGPRIQMDARKIEMVQGSDGWEVRYGTERFGSFGKNDTTARHAMRLLQDFRVTEYVQIGKTGMPLFLSFGQPLVKVPLGFNALTFKPGELKVKELNGKWFVSIQEAPFLEAGDTKEEAIRLQKVIQFYRFDRLMVVGNPLSGGMRVLVRDR